MQSPLHPFNLSIPELQYVYEGAGRIGDKAAQPEHAYVLHNEGDTVSMLAAEL